jgi:hypothetical protein
MFNGPPEAFGVARAQPAGQEKIYARDEKLEVRSEKREPRPRIIYLPRHPKIRLIPLSTGQKNRPNFENLSGYISLKITN